MYRSIKAPFLLQRGLHTIDGPTETLKSKIVELKKMRKRRKPEKDQFLVEVPESKSFLDTATLPMVLTVAGVALFAKLLMMVSCFHDSSRLFSF